MPYRSPTSVRSTESAQGGFVTLNRLDKLLPWLVLVMGLAGTYLVQEASLVAAREAHQEAFSYHMRDVKTRVEQRMNLYEQILHGAQAEFVAAKTVERQEFREYVNNQRLKDRYPGIQGVGF